MGNANTNIKKNEKNEYSNDLLFRTVNKISSDLILNTNNEDLLQFMNPEYCDKIINLTSNILNDNFTKNKLNIINNKIIKKNNKKPVDEFIQNLKDISNPIYDSEIYKKKNDICKEIAIYYVKIVHIFSAIKIVIDTDDSICNKTKKFKYDKINKGEVYQEDMVDKDVFDTTISADICSKKKSSKDIKTEKTLKNENGIPELENLFKDKYIPEREEFVMSEKQKKEYEKAVSKFYKGYTGNSKPDEIKRFSDIPILEYKSVELCEKMKDKSKSRLIGNSNNDNIVNFANHLATVMNNSRMFDKKLIEILNYLFIPNENGKDYVINENISFDDIDKIIEKVREDIMDLYITCDKDYRKGIKLFEKILLDKNIELAEKRLKPNKNFTKNVNVNINDYYKKKEEEDKEKKIEKDEKKNKKIEDNIKKLTEAEKEEEKFQKKLDKETKEMNEKLLAEQQREQDEIYNEDEILKKIIRDIEEAGTMTLEQFKAKVDDGTYKIAPQSYELIAKALSDMDEQVIREKKNELEELMKRTYYKNLCPFGHELYKGKYTKTGNNPYVCDICNRDIKPGDKMFFCDDEDCDFDMHFYHDENDKDNIDDIANGYYNLSKGLKDFEKDENNKKEHMSKENNILSELNEL